MFKAAIKLKPSRSPFPFLSEIWEALAWGGVFAPRLQLHACGLVFPHPRSGARIALLAFDATLGVRAASDPAPPQPSG